MTNQFRLPDSAIDLGPAGFPGSWWRIYKRGTMRSGLISGTPDNDRMQVITHIAKSAREAAPTTVWCAGPEHQLSVPGAVSWHAADPASIRDMLTDVANIVEARQHTHMGLAPSVEVPGLLVIIDPARTVLAETGIVPLVESFIGQCEAAGVAILFSDPSDDLAAFGGSSIIRDAVLSHWLRFRVAEARAAR